MNNSLIQIDKNLFLIKLIPPITGFKNFIGAWLYKSCGLNILMDVGPASTANQLTKILSHLKIKYLNYIILTHIHLDHAGAISQISEFFNKPVIICHEKGIHHLINPKKLWEESIKALGQLSKSYGYPKPLRSIPLSHKSTQFSHNIRIIETPGHSPHHICVSLNKYMFIGEAAGILLKFPNGNIYMRPATPPKFFINPYLKSINLILKTKPNILCYGHLWAIDSKYQTLQYHKKQLELWYSTVQKYVLNNPNREKNIIIKYCMDELLKIDPLLASIGRISHGAQKREKFFIKNSIDGLVENILVNTKSNKSNLQHM